MKKKSVWIIKLKTTGHILDVCCSKEVADSVADKDFASLVVDNELDIKKYNIKGL